MKFAKSILIGTGSVVLAGLIFALLAPRAARAIAATAVLVENTITSPVPTQSILPGTPFVTSCTTSSATGSCVLNPPIPAGYTLIASNTLMVTGYHSAPSLPQISLIQYTSGGVGATYFLPTNRTSPLSP